MGVCMYSNPYRICNISHSTPALNHFKSSQSWMNHPGFFYAVLFLQSEKLSNQSHLCFCETNALQTRTWSCFLYRSHDTPHCIKCWFATQTDWMHAWGFLLCCLLMHEFHCFWCSRGLCHTVTLSEMEKRAPWFIALSSWKHVEITVQIYSKQAYIG